MGTSKVFFSGNKVTSETSESMPLELYKNFAVISVVTNSTPGAFTSIAADTAVDPATDSITITAHGLIAGVKVQVSGAGLPTGLSAATDYYVIPVDANTIKLAASYANAVASTPVPVNITADGTGTMTLTPSSLAGSLVLQASNDGSNWAPVTNGSLTIDGNEAFFFEKTEAEYKFLRAVLTLTGGQCAVSSIFNSNIEV